MIDERAFWQSYEDKLHCVLTTEQPHPQTDNLSDLAQHDLDKAIHIWQDVNNAALVQCLDFEAQAQQIHQAIKTVRRQEGKIFLAGCGASGRLAVLLETLAKADNVVGLIAGGDVALIHAVEAFEDSAELAVKQLQQYGFTDKDLLIGLSVNGEAPFIQALVKYAAAHSQQPSLLVSCNPAAQLLERNPQHVIHLPDVQFIDLTIGPLALTGSTRLQTSDVMLWVLGQALLTDMSGYQQQTEELLVAWQASSADSVSDVEAIAFETDCYQRGDYILYQTAPAWGLTVLSDTTERAPTFNLIPFENQTTLCHPERQRRQTFSNCYMILSGEADNQAAWKRLLRRKPYCLNWPDFPRTGTDYFYGFDISESMARRRQDYLSRPQHPIILNGKSADLLGQLILKMRLNMRSTLIMGRLGLYEGNLMTSLYPGNNKLIDRAARYVQYLAQQRHQWEVSYRDAAEAVLALSTDLKPGESIIHKALQRFKNKH